MFFRRISKAALDLFRSSLQIRAMVYTVSLTGTALIIIALVLGAAISNGLYSNRTNQVLIESSRAEKNLEKLFEEGFNSFEINSALNRVVGDLQVDGPSQTRLVYFQNTGTSSESRQLEKRVRSENFDISLVSDDFRHRVKSSTTTQYQTIQIQIGGESFPAILTGQQFSVQQKYPFELYLVYDLKNEAQILNMVQWTLVFGGTFSLILIGFFSFIVTTWLVRPVKYAADVSEIIAQGDLKQRLPVKGTDVVAVWASSFNRMADSLKEKIDDLDQLSQMQQHFVSDVSHELKTPLTTMRISTDILYGQRTSFSPETKRAAELLHEQIDRFDRLLADLLEISRYDAGLTLQLERSDVNAIVGYSLDGIQQLAENKSVRLIADIPSGPVYCEVDARRIDRVLNNLLTNAVEHSEGKPVKIAVAENELAIAITVTDNGIGMNLEESSKVFDRFWRADPSRKRTTGGTGLGLAIALEDALAHSGKLEVAAELGVGSTFRLTIPKRQDIEEYESPLELTVEKLV